jgi:uncharacterized membrane protein YvbJ
VFCPSCGVEHDVTSNGRFCEQCGMSVGTTRNPQKVRLDKNVELKRVCGSCGVPAASEDTERCTNCGSKIVTLGGELD